MDSLSALIWVNIVVWCGLGAACVYFALTQKKLKEKIKMLEENNKD